ncbi:hypothetical protein BIW11_13652, partial [Tropilaelaps mercedesae]
MCVYARSSVSYGRPASNVTAMKALVALLFCGTLAVSRAQFSFGQFGGGQPGFGGSSTFQPPYQHSFGSGQTSFAGGSNPFDLFSSNTLNNNLFNSPLGRSAPFQVAPQSNLNTYS